MFESRKELIAYLAGFLDGEGSFIIIYDNNCVFSARANAGQVDLRPLDLLHQTFGGRIDTDKKTRSSRFSNTAISQWTVTGPAMYKMLLEIQPYLIVKAEQADCLISLQESINKYKGRVGHNREFATTPQEELQWRAVLYNRCKQLKHGPAATTKREGRQAQDGCDSLDCIDGKDAEAAEMTARLKLVRL